MAAGLKVWAQDGSGVLQIDDTNLNLFLRAKGVVTTDFKPQANYPPTQKLNTALSGFRGRPIVAVNCQLATMVNVTAQGNGNHNLNITINGPVGSQASWWAFDTLGNDEGSNFGLKVYDAQGRLQYDAVKKPMRIIDVIIGATGGDTRTYTAGRTYACAQSGGGGQLSVGGATPGYVLLVGGSQVVGNQVSVTRFQVLGGSGTSINDSRPHYGMVVDVTDY